MLQLANSGSTTRDFCMLERNVLSHIKLALLLSLLSFSLLLNPPSRATTHEQNIASVIPLAALEFIAAIACIVGGLWEYYRGFQDLRMAKALLTRPKLHLIVMGTVAGIVFGTCVVFLIQSD